MSEIGILAASYYLPSEEKAIADVFRDETVPSEGLAADVDFQRDLGIESVRVWDGAPSDLALEAARRVVSEAGIEPGEIDLLVDFTSIPEDFVAPTWAAAGRVQHELGASRALATAVNTGGCASYHVALKAACALMTANPRYRTALLFSGDKTPPLNHTYYPITVTCDGSSAYILRRGHQRRVVLAVETKTVGSLHDVWRVPGLPHRDPEAADPLEFLYMHSDLDRFNEAVIPINLFMFRKVMKGALKRAALKAADVDYYVYPTFSSWDQQSFREGFGIPAEKIYTEGLAAHGHLQENDMVVNYEEAVAAGRISEGDVVMVLTNGAGFNWSAALIRH